MWGFNARVISTIENVIKTNLRISLEMFVSKHQMHVVLLNKSQHFSKIQEIDQHPENIRMIMTHTIYNELSNTKNPNNMAIITTLFQKNGEQSARVGIYRSSSHNSVQVQCTSSKGTMFTSCKINQRESLNDALLLISKYMYIHLCTFDTRHLLHRRHIFKKILK